MSLSRNTRNRQVKKILSANLVLQGKHRIGGKETHLVVVYSCEGSDLFTATTLLALCGQVMSWFNNESVCPM